MDCARIQYLGQVGFSFEVRGHRLLVDPYLSEAVDRLTGWTRNYPAPVAPGELRDVDLVLCTHDHLDHADPESLRGIVEASPACVFAGPPPVVELMRGVGIDGVVLHAGGLFRHGGVEAEPVAAAHEDYEIDAHGRQRFLGYILRWPGLAVYHAGDTLVTPRLRETLRGHRFDIAFLPINGRDDARRAAGIVGNMDAREAVALACELAAGAGLGLVTPTHHDLYPANGARLGGFIDAWEMAPEPRPGFKVFLPGETLHLPLEG